MVCTPRRLVFSWKRWSACSLEEEPTGSLTSFPRDGYARLAMTTRRVLNGALAGGIAAAVWAAQQPLDKRVFGCDYDDVELLGKFVTRGSGWQAAGLAIHVQNGAAFGAAYAGTRPFLPGPPVALAIC